MQYHTMVIAADDFSRPRGWGNGYVAVPKSCPAFGRDYSEVDWQLDYSPHGGLTFGRSLLGCREDMFPEISVADRGQYYVFGFDTGHYGDTLDNCNEEFVKRETEALKAALMQLETHREACYAG